MREGIAGVGAWRVGLLGAVVWLGIRYGGIVSLVDPVDENHPKYLCFMSIVFGDLDSPADKDYQPHSSDS